MKNVQSIWTSVIKVESDRTQQSIGSPPSSSDAHATAVATCKVIYQLIDIFYHGSEGNCDWRLDSAEWAPWERVKYDSGEGPRR